MKSMSKHTIILFAFCVTSSLFPDTSARPNGFNELFTALAPSATGKPGTGDYTARDFVNDGMKNNLAFLNEICPPLARIADQLCNAVQNIVDRCIKLFVNGGNTPKGETPKGTTEAGSTDSGSSSEGTDSGSSTEGTAEETTPSNGSTLDSSDPKFGGGSTSESSSSESSSTESSTDKTGDKEGETTTEKQ